MLHVTHAHASTLAWMWTFQLPTVRHPPVLMGSPVANRWCASPTASFRAALTAKDDLVLQLERELSAARQQV